MTEGNARIRLELDEGKERDNMNISRSVCPQRDEGFKCTCAQNLCTLANLSQYSRVSYMAVWVARGNYPEEVMRWFSG